MTTESEELKQEFISKVKSSQYFYTSVVYTRDQVNQINILDGRNERLLAIHCSPVIEHKPGASVMTIEHMEIGEKAPLGVGEATELGYLLEKAATLIDELRRLRHKNEEKIKEIKYQAECPFCHPCTDENADHVTQKLLAILNRNEDKPLYICRAMGKETGFIMACYKNSLGQKKMKLFNIQIFNRSRLDILALQQFITPDHCLKCGRKLNDEDEKS